MLWRRKKRKDRVEISPEEILIDARNLPSYDPGRLEGRLNTPIHPEALWPLIVLIVLAGLIIFGRSLDLMAINGGHYKTLSEQNRLGHTLIFAERGIVYDRNGVELAWNVPYVEDGVYEEYNERAYASTTGSAHLVGFVRMPGRDEKGFFYSDGVEGVAGTELTYDEQLRGKQGTRIVETDARMELISEAVFEKPVAGKALTLSIDSRIQEKLYNTIGELANDIPFTGGAGIIMDVHTGEIIAMTSYPEYDPAALVSGDSERLTEYVTDERIPYLNRIISGQYTPGSIVKPYIAAAALTENIVRPETTFISTGALRLENPYSPGQYSVFTDWRAHGAVDMRRALAVSSNVYFYYVGGGFGDQEGLGIERIEHYMRVFGFGMSTGITLKGEEFGVIPSPEWKAATFPSDPTWRIGDTYHTTIGQYGFQVTPLQVVRAVASIANNGLLLTPRIETTYTQYTARQIEIPEKHLRIVRGGMREAVLSGTQKGLNVPYVAVAAKTGTAEIGVEKGYVHSWTMGFFPYEEPRYAFAIVMEHGPRSNLIGATYVMRQMLDWMNENTPEYVESNT